MIILYLLKYMFQQIKPIALMIYSDTSGESIWVEGYSVILHLWYKSLNTQI